MRYLLAIILQLVLGSGVVFAQCGNIDFEMNSFSGWTAYQGGFNCSAAGYGPGIILNPSGFTAGRFTVTSGIAFDPKVPSIPVVSPYGGAHSVRLGNWAVGWGAERLEYTFAVDAENALFTYQYAVIFQNPSGHGDAQPRFDVRVLDSGTGDTVNCGYYHVVSAGNIPGFQSINSVSGDNGNATNGCASQNQSSDVVRYRNWSLVAIDLTPYIGNNITIQFTTTDCGQGGHFGYAYIDAYCAPLQIAGHFCPGDVNTTLTAPPGFSGYQWSTGETAQSIVIAQPQEGDTVSVICIPFQGGLACATTLYFGFEQSPVVDVDFEVNALCGADSVQFADASGVATGGGTVNQWKWYINNVLVDTTNSMDYTFPGPGSYDITLISNSDNGCPDTLERSVTIPPGLVASVGSPAGYGVSCAGGNDGYAVVHILAGNPPFVYDWNNGAYNADSIYGLPIGQYTVQITDSAGCQVFDTVSITEPPPLAINPATENITCHGGSDGKIRLHTTGGVPPYTVNWSYSPVPTADSIFGLSTGTYAFTITDSKNCVFDSAIVLVQPPNPFVILHTHNDVNCYGGSDGSITITSTTGNTPGYTYAWNTNPIQTSTSIANLSFGSYTCTITDVNGCTTTLIQQVAQPPQLVLNTPRTNVRCFGESSGSISAIPSGGVPPYVYNWSTNSSNYAIPNIPAGDYELTVTDGHSCTVSVTVPITEPSLLEVTVASYDERCYGGTSARATTTPSGGSPPYYYVWSTSEPLQQYPTAINLAAGTYVVTITDSHACTTTASTVINEPPPLTVSVPDITHNICFGGRAGSSTAVGTGGSPGYQYRWNTVPPQLTATATGIPASTYRVTVTDDSLCTATAVVVINQPSPIHATYLASPALCYDSAQGSVRVYVHNGTPWYTYSWNPNVSTTDSAMNLLGGNYSVTITDANGCTQTLSDMFVDQPPQLAISTRQENPVCNGLAEGSITVSGLGGVPLYMYSLWGNDSLIAVNAAGEFLALPAATYRVQFVDRNDCVISTPVVITEPEPLQTTLTADSVNCYNYRDGIISLSASGGTAPYEYTLQGVSQNPWGIFYNLPAGEYNIHVRDVNYCFLDTTTTIYEPAPILIVPDPDSLVINLGETKPIVLNSNYDASIQYLWSPYDGLDCDVCSQVNVSVPHSNYYVVQGTTHPHDLDCIAEVRIPVTVIANYPVYVPTAFTPNGNGSNDFYEIFGDKTTWLKMKFQIFNRWGEKIYESTDPNFKWDGTYKGVPQSPMVYGYKLELTFIDGHTLPLKKGSITIIR